MANLPRAPCRQAHITGHENLPHARAAYGRYGAAAGHDGDPGGSRLSGVGDVGSLTLPDSSYRNGPKAKPRTFYVHGERQAVLSVGDVLLIFSTKRKPRKTGAAEVVERYDVRGQTCVFGRRLSRRPAGNSGSRKKTRDVKKRKRASCRSSRPTPRWRLALGQPTRPVAIDSEARRLGHRVRSVPGVGRLHARRIS